MGEQIALVRSLPTLGIGCSHFIPHVRTNTCPLRQNGVRFEVLGVQS